MKIAYLILAHDNPAHLRRMIRALRENWTEIFVHIDTKAPRGLFDTVRDEPQTHFIDQRVSACWGGFSLVRATLNLIEAACSSVDRPDRFVLLSGADYPIRSNRTILELLSRPKTEFISAIRMPTPDGRKPLSRLETLYFEEARGGYKPLRVLCTQANRLLERYYKRDYRSAIGDLRPYAGSQWWALSKDAIEYIVNFIDQNDQFVQFYRRSLIPDEMFFHTIVGNSPLSHRISRNVTYADWTAGLKRNPSTLSIEHIERFADPNFVLDDVEGKGPCLYARKFDASSATLVESIDVWRERT